MKMLTCECGHVVKGETEKEVMDNYWEHIKTAHPEMAEKSEKMSKREKDKMMNETRMRIMDE